MLNEQLQKDIEQEGTGASRYAALWQAAEEKAARYEKALKLIAQMSDPGDYWKAICQMKSIAVDALTQKTGEDEHS